VRRIAALFLFVHVLVGWGSDTGFYDDQAKASAKRAVSKGPFDGEGKVVSVGSPKERDQCPQAPSPKAGPCLNAVVTTELTAQPVPGTHSSAAGAKIQASFDAFIWLTKTRGRWKVTHTTYRPRGVAVDGVPYSPSE
jgi:hypothetical protein